MSSAENSESDFDNSSVSSDNDETLSESSEMEISREMSCSSPEEEEEEDDFDVVEEFLMENLIEKEEKVKTKKKFKKFRFKFSRCFILPKFPRVENSKLRDI